MMTLVVYDISDDNLRNKVADVLKDFGMRRIQKSAFIGRLTFEERKDLITLLKKKRLDENDRIDIFPICERDLKMHTGIVKGSVIHLSVKRTL